MCLLSLIQSSTRDTQMKNTLLPLTHGQSLSAQSDAELIQTYRIGEEKVRSGILSAVAGAFLCADVVAAFRRRENPPTFHAIAGMLGVEERTAQHYATLAKRFPEPSTRPSDVPIRDLNAAYIQVQRLMAGATDAEVAEAAVFEARKARSERESAPKSRGKPRGASAARLKKAGATQPPPPVHSASAAEPSPVVVLPPKTLSPIPMPPPEPVSQGGRMGLIERMLAPKPPPAIDQIRAEVLGLPTDRLISVIMAACFEFQIGGKHHSGLDTLYHRIREFFGQVERQRAAEEARDKAASLGGGSR